MSFPRKREEVESRLKKLAYSPDGNEHRPWLEREVKRANLPQSAKMSFL